MPEEISLFGVFAPAPLICALCAYAATLAIKRAFRALGLYKSVWHPALFNLSLFICLAGGASLLLTKGSL